MTDQLISFETAKLAKEKGCSTECRDYYDEHGNLNTTNIQEIISAPTQSLLQKWLREVYHISIDIISMYEGDYGFTISVLKDGHHYVHLKRQNVGSYEEALEEGLQEALKTIKNK